MNISNVLKFPGSLILIFLICVPISGQSFSITNMDTLLYGVAYYPEYMPYERVEEDASLMRECGINVVRICESTWSYMEPHDGEFNFDYIGRVMDIMHKNGIKVIIGTPTYAIPAWLAKKDPDVLATTRDGKNLYGSRQNMDITNPIYLFHAERIIRKLLEHVYDHPAVIGYQVDNETKHYGTAGNHVQKLFIEYLKKEFGTIDEMNLAFGLNYWSNSIYSWEDMPSTLGTINGSLGSVFNRFQRKLVTDFLAWQCKLVNEYKKPGQFITHNFDLEWRSGSFAIQPNVDHFEASRPLDIAGIDVYHQTQEKLDGVTIALAGDLARSMKQDNYLVIETQSQSIINSTTQQLPYPGQMRLQAFSHLASGANMVAYWPWHSIHNSLETYWKGILSHDFEKNATFEEARQIASEFRSLGNNLINLKKNNRVAIYFSNESLTAIDNWFPFSNKLKYNDVLKTIYEVLYKMNIECDFIDHTVKSFGKYKVIIVPLLYSAAEEELKQLNDFVNNGGIVLYTFKSGFTDEYVKVRHERMPAVIRDVCGFSYQQFTNTGKIKLKDNPFSVKDEDNYVSEWAELLIPEKASVLAWYDHPYWGKYAALTENQFEKGRVFYMGSWPSQPVLEKLLQRILDTGDITVSGLKFPLILRQGINLKHRPIRYFFNYSGQPVTFQYDYKSGKELFSGKAVKPKENINIPAWDLIIIEEN
jgi:beta-galactosidase